MLARLQALIVVVLVSAALGWAVLLGEWGHPVAAIVGAVLIFWIYAFVLGAEFLGLAAAMRKGESPPAAAVELWSAWWQEVRVSPKVFMWRQPFRSLAEPDHLPAAAAGRIGVVLVHGLFCTRGFWNPVLLALSERGIPFVAITLEPTFGAIDGYAPAIDAAVVRLAAATGREVVLVGHSMGGIAIRAWLASGNHTAGDEDPRVRRVITIGSPHHGTLLAQNSHAANGRQMRRSSPWLAALAARETTSRRALFTCFWGPCDNIVVPGDSAALEGADNHRVPTTPHVQMAYHPRVFDEVLRWVEPPATDARTASQPVAG